MKLKPLGTYGPLVSSLGLGTWGYGGFFESDHSRDNFFIDLIRLAVDLGITFIDTAEAYGDGHCEEIVGRAVRGIRNRIFIATKVSPEHLACMDIIKAAEKSLVRLGVDWIDIYQIHWPNPLIPIDETIEAMNRLVDQGKIRYIGVSNFSPAKLVLASDLASSAVVSVQTEYNLFDRSAESNLLPLCMERGIALIAYSPLDQGKSLSTHKEYDLLLDIAAEHGRTVSQIILNWIVSHGPVIPIPRTMKPEHLRMNAEALDFELSDDEIALVSKAFPCNPIYIPVEQIMVDDKGLSNFTPGPAELAIDILAGDPLKPIRVTPSETEFGKYNLVEGKLRYWAWVHAHGNRLPVPALVR